MTSPTGNEDGDFELDFTNVDRIAQHLAEGAEKPREDDRYVDIPIWHETTEELYELYSIESIVKAQKLIKGKKVNAAEGRPDLFNITGSDLYVARIIELGEDQVPGVTCTCPNGANRSGRPTCYHSAAALIVHLGPEHEKITNLLKHLEKEGRS